MEQRTQVVAKLYAIRTLLVLTGVALLVNYVETMVIPAVPTIQAYFSSTATTASWITSAYLIVGGAVSPLFGKLGDAFGKKKIFLVSLIFYMVGVACAGFSPSISFLIFARGLQGIGFAIIPLSLSILTDVFPKERLGIAQGVISATYAIGAAAGLTVGSYIIQDLGWQYAFHTALILSLVLFFVFAKLIQRDSSRVKMKIDYSGAAVLMAGVTLLLVYITQGPSLGWLSPEEIVIIIVGVVLTILFFALESKRTAPLIRLQLLRIRNVLAANLILLLTTAVMLLFFYAVVYYATNPSTFGLNLGIIATGLTIAPACVAMIVEGPALGAMMRRTGPKPVLVLGAGLQVIGALLFLGFRGTRLDVIIDSVILLAGTVSLLVSASNMIATSLPKESISVGFGMNMIFRNLGGAIGPVAATVIMTTYVGQYFVGGRVTELFFANSTAFNVIAYIAIILSVIIFAISLIAENYTFKENISKLSHSPRKLSADG